MPVKTVNTDNEGREIADIEDGGAVVVARHSARRMQAVRDRRRRGVMLVTFEIGTPEINKLIERGWLSHDQREDRAAVSEALAGFAKLVLVHDDPEITRLSISELIAKAIRRN